MFDLGLELWQMEATVEFLSIRMTWIMSLTWAEGQLMGRGQLNTAAVPWASGVMP